MLLKFFKMCTVTLIFFNKPVKLIFKQNPKSNHSYVKKSKSCSLTSFTRDHSQSPQSNLKNHSMWNCNVHFMPPDDDKTLLSVHFVLTWRDFLAARTILQRDTDLFQADQVTIQYPVSIESYFVTVVNLQTCSKMHNILLQFHVSVSILFSLLSNVNALSSFFTFILPKRIRICLVSILNSTVILFCGSKYHKTYFIALNFTHCRGMPGVYENISEGIL